MTDWKNNSWRCISIRIIPGLSLQYVDLSARRIEWCFGTLDEYGFLKPTYTASSWAADSSLMLDFRKSVGIINHLPMSRMDGTCMAKVSQHVSTINQSMRSSWIKGQKGSKRVKKGQSQAADHWDHWVNVSHICTAPAWMRIPCISGWDHHGRHNHRGYPAVGVLTYSNPLPKCAETSKKLKTLKNGP